jgi:hypothetical protein
MSETRREVPTAALFRATIVSLIQKHTAKDILPQQHTVYIQLRTAAGTCAVPLCKASTWPNDTPQRWRV